MERRFEHDEEFTGKPSTGFRLIRHGCIGRFNVCFFERKFDDALNVLWRSPLENLHGQTSTPLPKSFLAAQVYRLIPHAEKAQTEYQNALSIAQRALEESPQDSARHALIGLIYAGLGRKEDAIREGNRALELLPESKDAIDAPVLMVAMARIYTITGESEKAIDLLQHSMQTPAGLNVMKFVWTRLGTCCANIPGLKR